MIPSVHSVQPFVITSLQKGEVVIPWTYYVQGPGKWPSQLAQETNLILGFICGQGECKRYGHFLIPCLHAHIRITITSPQKQFTRLR